MDKKYITYISRLYLKDYKCFKGVNEFNLLDKKGKLKQWTVILGNNSTGKTNLLKAIADLEPTLLKTKEESCLPINFFRRTEAKNTSLEKNKGSWVGCDILYKEYDTIENHFNSVFSIYKGKEDFSLKEKGRPFWGYSPERIWSSGEDKIFKYFEIFGYGVTRRIGRKGIAENETPSNAQTLFDSETTLINVEDWLFQLDYAAKNNQKTAKSSLEKVVSLIKSEIFPEIMDFKFSTSPSLNNYMEFLTQDGWLKFEDLGYGYQTTLSWLIDLCKKMLQRSPNSESPFAEPAIVLVDEIDLHLHPSWQKNIVKFLTNLLPNTQFIVTTHSPLIIQSIEELNLFILFKNKEGVAIKKFEQNSFKGWTVEEILSDLMNLESGVYSTTYLELYKSFDKALDENNYKKAQAAYKELDKILHPDSSQRKIISLQLSQIAKK